MSAIRTGLVLGALATAPMTLVLVVSRRLGLFHVAPPEEIAKNAASEVGLDEVAYDPDFGPIWLGLHVVFGAGGGLGYAFVRPRLPQPPIAGGVVYGLLVWAVNYVGLMPALGLFPPLHRVGSRRTVVMIVAHIVYGAALAAMFPSFRARR